MTIEYDDESLICPDCTEDKGLKKRIKVQHNPGRCCICHKFVHYSIGLSGLADWVSDIWSQWYCVGESRPHAIEASDKPQYEQMGELPEPILRDLLKLYSAEDEALIIQTIMEIMSRDDYQLVKDGGDPFIDESQQYERVSVQSDEIKEVWEDFVVGIKHHTRYFNSRAAEFFEKLFLDIDEVHVTDPNYSHFNSQADELHQPVIREYIPGSLNIFRARKVDKTGLISNILDNPKSELRNPPDEFSSEGRMNAKGISYFYGAEDRETCIAEIRPSISESLFTVQFELIKKIRLLDLTQLADSFHFTDISMFEDDYRERIIHRELLRQLHRLISKPILDGDEFDYIPTQAMSEYLARRKNIDGIIFGSVQRKGGRNIVLFPHVLESQNHSAKGNGDSDSAICLIEDSIRHHEITALEHKFSSQTVKELASEMTYAQYDGDWMDF